MASITVRKLDDDLKARLRMRAARHGRSMEEEARDILRGALAEEPVGEKVGLGTAIRRIFGPLGGVELDIPPRAVEREPPDFR